MVWQTVGTRNEIFFSALRRTRIRGHFKGRQKFITLSRRTRRMRFFLLSCNEFTHKYIRVDIFVLRDANIKKIIYYTDYRGSAYFVRVSTQVLPLLCLLFTSSEKEKKNGLALLLWMLAA